MTYLIFVSFLITINVQNVVAIEKSSYWKTNDFQKIRIETAFVNVAVGSAPYFWYHRMFRSTLFILS